MATSKSNNSSQKYIKPSDPRHKYLTPAQRNANTLLGLKQSVAAPKKETSVVKAAKPTMTAIKKGATTAAKTASKVIPKAPANKPTSKPVTKPTPKKTSVVAAAKPIMKNITAGAAAASKAASTVAKSAPTKPKAPPIKMEMYPKKPTIKAAGTGKVSSVAAATAGKAPAKKETFNLDAEVKKTMSGAYGSGEARKKALGANYAAVQAEINKRAAANKPKTSTAPKAAPAKTETKSEPIVMKTKKVTEIPTSGSKSISPIATKSGGSGLGAKEKTDQEMAKLGFRKGGAVKKYQDGGTLPKKPKPFSTKSSKIGLGILSSAIAGITGKVIGDAIKARKAKKAEEEKLKKEKETQSKSKEMKRGGMVKRKMKTGGMVNPNANVSYQKIAGSKGVTSGVNAKASASKYASSKGSGNANTPPSKATPAAKRGGAVKMKRGGMIKRK